MSFASDLDVYEGIGYDGVIEKSNFAEERLPQCVALSKPERVGESLVVGEEIVVGASGPLLNDVNRNIDQMTEATMYFEETLENQNCNKMAIKYEEPNTSVPSMTGSSMIEKWDCEDMDTLSSRESELDSCNDEQDADEETIATFVTAEGQQLALYAVEDSDEIFAVAVYDESGESPTNFQFLIKADVERLIGQGAVRTVKKPTQMKKRLLTTQPPVFLHKEGFEEVDEQTDDETTVCDSSIGDEDFILQQENCGTGYDYKDTSHQNYGDKINSTSSDVIYTVADDKQSDITYLMMDDECPVNIDEQSNENRELEDNELMKRSTVQYILFEDDQSDSELTFDEIQATLQNLRTNRKNASTDDDASAVDEQSCKSSQDDYACLQREILRESPLTRTTESSLSSSSSSSSNAAYRETQCTARMSSDNDETDDRQRLIDALTDSPPPREAAQPRLKRSRKQQLTSMNRDDGEIIIQPASMLSEELTGKKRGRRRRPKLSQDRAIGHGYASKRIKKKKRQQVVEVIDLDVDEEEQQKRNVVEITLDDKDDGKYSSDKENEIITVRDSDSNDDDDEEEEEEEEEELIQTNGLTKLGAVMQCEHCSRSFRQRRAFDTHLRICQKSPKNTLRLDDRKQKEQQVRKQYACKVCQKKFDVVVVLARHVRAEHSHRKKHKWGPTSQKTQDKSLRSMQQKQTEEEQEEEEEGEEEEEEKGMEDEKSSDDDNAGKKELTMLSRVKRKRKQTSNSWEAKKLSCADCGRWFPSSALLDAHSLQHGTKKSEQQLRKCQICKKLIKSRLLFLRHVKMHNDTKQCSLSSTRSPSTMLRKLRARPGKITSLRKRGRPRKF